MVMLTASEPAQNNKGLRSRVGIRWFLLSASVWWMKKTNTTRWNGLAADSAKVRNEWIISLDISFSVEILVRCSLLRRPYFVVELESDIYRCRIYYDLARKCDVTFLSDFIWLTEWQWVVTRNMRVTLTYSYCILGRGVAVEAWIVLAKAIKLDQALHSP